VVKGGTLGPKMRPVLRSRPTRASEWPWAITGGEPSAARRVLRSSEFLQQPSGGANVLPPRIFPTNPRYGIYLFQVDYRYGIYLFLLYNTIGTESTLAEVFSGARG
jgi:hypothetical protein